MRNAIKGARPGGRYGMGESDAKGGTDRNRKRDGEREGGKE